jgi:hypothetical protein
MNKTAVLLRADGTRDEVQPINGRKFKLEELYVLIGCACVEHISLPDGCDMWLDEECKLKDPLPELNATATLLLAWAGGIPGDYILGNVLITYPKQVA